MLCCYLSARFLLCIHPLTAKTLYSHTLFLNPETQKPEAGDNVSVISSSTAVQHMCQHGAMRDACAAGQCSCCWLQQHGCHSHTCCICSSTPFKLGNTDSCSSIRLNLPAQQSPRGLSRSRRTQHASNTGRMLSRCARKFWLFSWTWFGASPCFY